MWRKVWCLTPERASAPEKHAQESVEEAEAAERKLLVALPKCKFIGYEEVERVAIGLVKTKTNTKVPPAAWETTWESKAQSAMLRLPLSPRESHLWLDRGWKTLEAGPHCVQKLNSAATLRIKSVLQLVLKNKKGFNQHVLERQIN